MDLSWHVAIFLEFLVILHHRQSIQESRKFLGLCCEKYGGNFRMDFVKCVTLILFDESDTTQQIISINKQAADSIRRGEDSPSQH